MTKQKPAKTVETKPRRVPIDLLGRVTGGGNLVIMPNGDVIWIG